LFKPIKPKTYFFCQTGCILKQQFCDTFVILILSNLIEHRKSIICLFLIKAFKVKNQQKTRLDLNDHTTTFKQLLSFRVYDLSSLEQKFPTTFKTQQKNKPNSQQYKP